MDTTILTDNPAFTNVHIPTTTEGIIDFEIHGIEEFTDPNGETFCEQINEYGESPDADFYSIYARYKRDDPNHNPLECIADCKDYTVAENMYTRLCDILKTEKV